EKRREAAFERLKIPVRECIKKGMSEDEALEAVKQRNRFDWNTMSGLFRLLEVGNRQFLLLSRSRRQYIDILRQYAQEEKQKYDEEQRTVRFERAKHRIRCLVL